MKKRKVFIIITMICYFVLGINVKAERVEKLHNAEYFCSNGNPKEEHYESELEIGHLYNYVNYIPIFDNGRGKRVVGKYKSIKYTTRDLITYQHITWTDYEAVPWYVYSVYEIAIVDAPYWSEIPELYYDTGKTIKYTFTNTYTKTKTYEVAMTDTLTKQLGIKIGLNSDSELNGQIKDSFEKEFKASNTIQESVSFNKTTERDLWGDGFYCFQKRAIYKMYIVLSFKAEYSKTIREEKVIWHKDKIHTNTLKGYAYLGSSVQFAYSGEPYITLSRYLPGDDGKRYFVPRKDSVTYNDNYIYL